MNRRGISGWVLGIAGIALLALVGVTAYAAGSASAARPGFMREGMGIGFGGFGWGLGWLIMPLFIVGAVWALVTLLRPDDRRPPPPPGWAWREPPQDTPPHQPGMPPLPPGYAEAFEAWHREAHRHDTETAAAAHSGAPAAEEPQNRA